MTPCALVSSCSPAVSILVFVVCAHNTVEHLASTRAGGGLLIR